MSEMKEKFRQELINISTNPYKDYPALDNLAKITQEYADKEKEDLLLWENGFEDNEVNRRIVKEQVKIFNARKNKQH